MSVTRCGDPGCVCQKLPWPDPPQRQDALCSQLRDLIPLAYARTGRGDGVSRRVARLLCRLRHSGVLIDDGPRAVWCIRCGRAR